MSNPLSPDEFLTLRRQVGRDLVLDTLGNSALVIGLWGWFGDASAWHPLLESREVIIALTATGLLNLMHLPARLRQLYRPLP